MTTERPTVGLIDQTLMIGGAVGICLWRRAARLAGRRTKGRDANA